MFSVRDVLLGLWVNVFFRQAKVDDVDRVLPLGTRSANQEVLGFHISIDQASGVDKLHASYLGDKMRAEPIQRLGKLPVVNV